MHRLMLRSEGMEPDPLVADLATGTAVTVQVLREQIFFFNLAFATFRKSFFLLNVDNHVLRSARPGYLYFTKLRNLL
jgi:hypothetical protein